MQRCASLAWSIATGLLLGSCHLPLPSITAGGGDATIDIYAPAPDLALDVAHDARATDVHPSATDSAVGQWEEVPTGVTATLRGVWGSQGDDVWVVGDRGTILHYDGAVLHRVPFSFTSEDLNDVWGLSAARAWIVGDMGTILSREGPSWKKVDSAPATVDLFGIWAASESDIWIAGENGTLVHFNGASWRASTEGSEDLNAIWGCSAAAIWAVGDQGVALLYEGPGPGWSEASSGTTSTLRGVWGRSAAEVYVALTGGVLRYDDDAWSAQEIATAVSLRDVGGRQEAMADDDVWAVGGDDAGDGVIFHLESGHWSVALRHPGVSFRAVWVASSGDVWVVGSRGTAFRFRI